MQAEVGCRGAGAAGATLCPRLRPENLLAVAGPVAAEEAVWGQRRAGRERKKAERCFRRSRSDASGFPSRAQGGTLKLYKEPGAGE